MHLSPAGYEVDSIHEASDPVDAVRKAEGIFIGEEQQRKAAAAFNISPFACSPVLISSLPFLLPSFVFVLLFCIPACLFTCLNCLMEMLMLMLMEAFVCRWRQHFPVAEESL